MGLCLGFAPIVVQSQERHPAAGHHILTPLPASRRKQRQLCAVADLHLAESHFCSSSRPSPMDSHPDMVLTSWLKHFSLLPSLSSNFESGCSPIRFQRAPFPPFSGVPLALDPPDCRPPTAGYSGYSSAAQKIEICDARSPWPDACRGAPGHPRRDGACYPGKTPYRQRRSSSYYCHLCRCWG